MSSLVHIEPGQWVLAFHQPYGPYDETLPELLESYAYRHWMEVDRKEDVFFVLQASKVMPKTFLAAGSNGYVKEGERLPRSHVIAGCKSEAEALSLRDRFFAIGEVTCEKIEKEMRRRVQKFADRERGKALKKIHRTLPHIFGRD